MKLIQAVTLVAMTLAAAPPVLACQGTTVVATADNWKSNTPQVVSKAPGEFQVTLTTNHYDASGMLEAPDNSVGVCADVTMESTGQAADNGIGISFWAASSQNTYGLEVTPKGQYAVYHIIDTKWYVLAPLTNSDAIHKGLNHWNDVEMEPEGNGFTVSHQRQADR